MKPSERLSLTMAAALTLSVSMPTVSAAQQGMADGAGEGLSITYLSAPLADPNYGAVACGARIEAKRLGVDFAHQESQDFSAAGQLPDINAAVASAPSALMITPTDPNALIAPLTRIVADGIPVVTTINELTNAAGITAEVAVSNYSAGKLAADFIAEQADGAKVTLAALSFLAGGSLAADEELRGFEEGIAAYDNITYAGASYVDSDAASSTQAMNAVLAREPELFGVFTAFGASAQGVLASTRQRGVKPVIVSGYAANTSQIVQALGTGEVAAIVDFPFRDAGAAALSQAVMAALDLPVEKRQEYESVIYTQDDAASLSGACPL